MIVKKVHIIHFSIIQALALGLLLLQACENEAKKTEMPPFSHCTSVVGEN
jgi:hypothetical protein